ncbi:MAG: class I SAM-dependent methyltransferase [Acholeplasmatales bacterium]|nr:class I SAM-dependent methyltransferase [Acholeplasmatales bacterium]
MDLEEYYNKFNEDKRLKSRHGQVEFYVSLKYILEYLNNDFSKKVIDVGAGTGRYSIELAKMGYDVTAVELTAHNFGNLKANVKKEGLDIPCYRLNALDLKKIKSNSYDLVILFGPMYHLHSKEDKLQALSEAYRILREGGICLVAYTMNEYSVIRHGFMDNLIVEEKARGKIDENYHVTLCAEDLYDYVRMEDIIELVDNTQFSRIKTITPDALTDYLRFDINKMSDEAFELYKDYVYKISARPDVLGLSSHTVDILKK